MNVIIARFFSSYEAVRVVMQLTKSNFLREIEYSAKILQLVERSDRFKKLR